MEGPGLQFQLKSSCHLEPLLQDPLVTRKEEINGLGRWTSSCLALGMPLVSVTSGGSHTCVTKMEEVGISQSKSSLINEFSHQLIHSLILLKQNRRKDI